MSLKKDQRLFSILLLSVFLCFLTYSKAYSVQLELEVGRVKLLKNKIKIPGDSGTLFDTTEVSPTEDYFYRLNLYGLCRKSSLRFLYAPLEINQSGKFSNDIAFDRRLFKIEHNKPPL